jgi:hypothetical protein
VRSRLVNTAYGCSTRNDSAGVARWSHSGLWLVVYSRSGPASIPVLAIDAGRVAWRQTPPT